MVKSKLSYLGNGSSRKLKFGKVSLQICQKTFERKPSKIFFDLKALLSKEHKTKTKNIHLRIFHLLFEGIRLEFELGLG